MGFRKGEQKQYETLTDLRDSIANDRDCGQQQSYKKLINFLRLATLQLILHDERTDKEYIFYLDGVEKWRTSTALSHHSEYIILSTEITGWGGDASTGTYPDKTFFDYVRVYTKK